MERHNIPMLAQMYASEQRPIGFDQKDMMKTNAAERSKEARREIFQSPKERRSFTIFRKAVSV